MQGLKLNHVSKRGPWKVRVFRLELQAEIDINTVELQRTPTFFSTLREIEVDTFQLMETLLAQLHAFL